MILSLRNSRLKTCFFSLLFKPKTAKIPLHFAFLRKGLVAANVGKIAQKEEKLTLRRNSW